MFVQAEILRCAQDDGSYTSPYKVMGWQFNCHPNLCLTVIPTMHLSSLNRDYRPEPLYGAPPAGAPLEAGPVDGT